MTTAASSLMTANAGGFAAVAQSPDGSRPQAGDFFVPLAVLLALGAAIWWVWQNHRKSPTRGLRRVVERARDTNERMAERPMPHPVPEMEMEPPTESLNPFEPQRATEERPSRLRQKPSDTKSDIPLDEEDKAALEQLARLVAEPDPKDILMDYRRLDTFIRHYLYSRYHIKAFGVSAAAIVASLPQDPAEGALDYAGEILHVCEIAELPRFKPSRNELRQLYDLAEEFIYHHARVAARREGRQ